MKPFWRLADRVFLGLLVLEMAAAGIYLIDLGLGNPWLLQRLITTEEQGTLFVWISSLQLAIIGFLFLRSIRRRAKPAGGPSCTFLVTAGIFFLLLAMGRAGGFLQDMVFRAGVDESRLRLADPFAWLPVALLLALFLFQAGRRSFAAMWTRFHHESLIMLAGLWLLLFGTIGLEALHATFLRNGVGLETAMQAFLEMAGGTVILYGALLFGQNHGGEEKKLAAA